ncbi:Na+/H+ antiporter NhaA [Sinomicrobium soli]|uniref:Na+/H+ antiporter NhaA n=1 Tax=Sinomicrobium sp. N-1-3-6 TaxID=2219864 RepID=UPI000DCCD1C5|nr:Na+/H+ antiporter NhaA [Sinomicrobium sp. N-1-3-6]RAV29624.1 Na+/H+ antiporter NhaA [Sinomicrobium sp. N-1-3-6]
MKKTPIDKILIDPLSRFINKSTTGGVVLFLSAVVAMILANSPLKDAYHHFWEHEFALQFDSFVVSNNLHHWVNDGLMAIFFFVVGLELKREMIAGELSRPKNAILPLMAALGGMIFPAAVYLIFNHDSPAVGGWGIPMATDIAFALGILYLLGDKVPISLKVFLTALAIADDLGAVLVIALFYTSDIDTMSLVVGAVFLLVLLVANRLGVRAPVFYGIIGIGGLWMAFLFSGVHATIAGVLAAFTIPAESKVRDKIYVEKMRSLIDQYDNLEGRTRRLKTPQQQHVLEQVRIYSKAALTPLQRLEHSMHSLVSFFVMPVFALANAGVTFSGDFWHNITSNVSIGIICGLVIGKFVGVVGFTKLMTKLRIASLPPGLNWKHIYGVALLASIGFTMSLFITELAFKTNAEEYILEAKMGIFAASIIGGILGYFILKKASRQG